MTDTPDFFDENEFPPNDGARELPNGASPAPEEPFAVFESRNYSWHFAEEIADGIRATSIMKRMIGAGIFLLCVGAFVYMMACGFAVIGVI